MDACAQESGRFRQSPNPPIGKRSAAGDVVGLIQTLPKFQFCEVYWILLLQSFIWILE